MVIFYYALPRKTFFPYNPYIHVCTSCILNLINGFFSQNPKGSRDYPLMVQPKESNSFKKKKNKKKNLN